MTSSLNKIHYITLLHFSNNALISCKTKILTFGRSIKCLNMQVVTVTMERWTEVTGSLYFIVDLR